MKNGLRTVVLALALVCAGAVNGQTADDHSEAGRNHYVRKEYDKAVESFTRAINLQPGNGVYYIQRGNAYSAKGERRIAIIDYTGALQRLNYNDSKNRSVAHNNRGNQYYSLGEYDNAVNDYKEAARLDPNEGLYKESLAKATAKTSFKPDAKTSRSTVITTITFTSPGVAAHSNYNVRACVMTGGRTVDRVQLTVNGSAQRGINVVRNDGCDHSVNQMVSLSVGENKIQVAVTADGSVTSETFVVVYRPEPVAPVSGRFRPSAGAAAPSAVDGRRVALVIGNANYRNAPLQNSVNDANQVAAKLRSLDFAVTIVTDADNRTMKRSINDFADRAKGSAIALFYYAGHGVQHNNVNYFLPVDIGNIERLSDVEEDGTSMDRVMRAMDATKANVKIVMLDACRNNVFTRGAAGGLAGPNMTPEGTFIAYATAPGQVALDNSPFTKSFLRHVDTPGLKIEDLFKNVLADVKKTTGGAQQPWTSSSLDGNFYFKPR